MLTVKISLDGVNQLEVSGDVTLADAKPLIDQWFTAVPAAQQGAVDLLTARVHKSTDKLRDDVTAATPGA